MKKFSVLLKKENGDFVIESTIVLTIVMIFIFFLLMLGFYLFQQMCVYVVANDTATSIAAIYSYESKDPVEGLVSQEDYSKTNIYRHVVSGAMSVLGVDSQKENKNKGKWNAYYSLRNYQYIAPINDPEVDLIFKTISPFKTQVTVNIKAEYSMPIAGMLNRVLGNSDSENMTFSATGSAICIDLYEYFSRIDFYCKISEIVTDSSSVEEMNGNITKIKTSLDKVMELFKDET